MQNSWTQLIYIWKTINPHWFTYFIINYISSYGFLCICLNIYWNKEICVDLYEFVSIYINLHQFVYDYTYSYGFVWCLYGFIWICIDLYWFAWKYIDLMKYVWCFYGFVMIHMDLYANIYISISNYMNLYELNWILSVSIQYYGCI